MSQLAREDQLRERRTVGMTEDQFGDGGRVKGCVPHIKQTINLHNVARVRAHSHTCRKQLHSTSIQVAAPRWHHQQHIISTVME